MRRMRGEGRQRRRGEIREVERVHARRMRGEEGRTNVCSREGACEKDEGTNLSTQSSSFLCVWRTSEQ